MAASTPTQTFDAANQLRRASLLQRTLRVGVALSVFGFVVSWFDPNNIFGGNRAPSLTTLAAPHRVFLPKPTTHAHLVGALATVVGRRPTGA